MPDKKFTATLRNISTGEKRDQEFDAVDMLEAGGIADGFIKPGEELIRIELKEMNSSVSSVQAHS